jgi:hypothetical protein
MGQNPLSYYILYNESKNNFLAFVGKANKEICWVTCPPDTLKKNIDWVIYRVLKTQCNEERLCCSSSLCRGAALASIVIESSEF